MSWFSDGDRARLRLCADLLMPDAEGMPSASSVGAADGLLDQVVNLRPDLAPMILRAIRSQAEAEPRFALEQLRAHDPESYAAPTLALAAAYYLSPIVCELIGYSGPRRMPADADMKELDSLLQPVRARGPVWRAAKADTGG